MVRFLRSVDETACIREHGGNQVMARRMTIVEHKKRTPRKRPGVHAKAGESRLKQSKNYKKKYRGQGR